VPPSTAQKRSQEALVQRFEQNQSRVLPYLTGRGLADAAERFRLGFVEPADDLPRKYWNRMAVPYLTPTGPVQIRYKCILDHDHKGVGCSKMLGDSGVEVTLYNPGTLLDATGPVVIVEGEPDTWAIETLAGLPAVGIPGAQSWKRYPYWARCFVGLDLILPVHGDTAGDSLAETISADLPEIHVVRLPDGTDSASLLERESPEDFRRRLGC
jgi:DNA primase